MKRKALIICLIFIFTLSFASWAKEISKSTSEDQVDVEVTIYNSNLGLVKDVRKVALPRGTGELRFMDVASGIKPVTVKIRSLNYPDKFSVLEQNYEYDLMNANKLLDKYVGRKIKIVDWNKYKGRKEVVDALLLSNNNGQIYKINNEIYLGHPGYKVLPKIPENLIAKPTLTWLYNNQIKKRHKLETSYLTDGINWKADYVVVLNKDDTSCDLSGWVTIDNKSGATYKDARLKLVAGKVHKVEEKYYTDEMVLYEKLALAGKPQFKEEGFFEYHLYDLQRRTTLKNNQTKQISLLDAEDVRIDKELRVYGIRSYYTRRYRPENPKQPVEVYVNLMNSEDNNLGMPLPEGIMRLYKKDKEESLQFIGEDRIEHTPKNEKISLKIGEAFDVVAERIQTDYKHLGGDVYESEWEITLRNHKKDDIIVNIIEPLCGDWQIIDNNYPYKKIDAFTIKFNVNVPKDGEVKVRYRARIDI